MTSPNSFYESGVEKVTIAITMDKAGDYDKSLNLYKAAIEYFMLGLKYDTNPASKSNISNRCKGYMERAEQLKNIIDGVEPTSKKDDTGGTSATKHKPEDSKEDEEKAKIRGALSSSIVSEKPNVKWTDVAGMDAAKEALKEAVILPIRFPQFFTGKRQPWKGLYN
jgi:vacuolar protein-sorting-associated protein 4